MIVKIKDECGAFAENKDEARRIREECIRPALAKEGEPVILDFTDVDSSTQSFMHALISDIFHISGDKALERIEFKGCSKPIKALVATVVNYSMD